VGPPARLRAAAAAVRRRTRLRPEVGLVLGSGLGAAFPLDGAVEIPYGRIPGFPRSSVAGHAGVLAIGRAVGRAVAVLRGRVHTYEGHAPEAVVFPVRLLALLGVRAVVLTSAVGAIRPGLRPGDLMLVRDHLNLMLGARFPAARVRYDTDVARRAGVRLPSGVYAAVTGPSYETPAEVRALRRLGADAVGMSLVPEALAAAEAGLRTAAVAVAANRAAGLDGGRLTHEEVLASSARALPRLRRALRRLVASL
jgi:purine-nucleoside phosphorylase